MKLKLDIDEVKYIKIMIPKAEDSSETIRATIKDINDREIIACGKLDSSHTIETPQEVVMSIVCDDGIYRTKTKIKSYEKEEPYAFFYLETPENIDYRQDREYFRVLAFYDCEYEVVINDEPIVIKAKSVDISASGLSLFAPSLLVSNNDAKLKINIDGEIIETKARFVRNEKVEQGYRISFAYTNISKKDRDLISKVCLAKQIEEKRNRLV